MKYMKNLILSVAAVLVMLPLAAREKPKAFPVGGYEVYLLVENSGNGSTDILIDAPKAVLEKYAPDGTFPNAVNAVLIRNGNEIWLVDTGFGRNIFGDMAALGIAPEDVNHILLTHMHGDHIGGMFRDGEPAFPNADVTVSRREYDYWSSAEEMNRQPENRRGGFIAAQKVFAEYGDRLLIVEPSLITDEFSDGITPVAAYGHTPGHIMFMIKDGREQLLIWGDLTHAMAIQMPHPEISVTYDVDPAMARANRMAVLRNIADKDIAVFGMHVRADGGYPGKVYQDGALGGYTFREE